MSGVYSMKEVQKHNKDDDCWIVIDGQVYDVSEFVNEHPGGEVILDGAGSDATELFEDIGHSDSARDLLKVYHIGKLE